MRNFCNKGRTLCTCSRDQHVNYFYSVEIDHHTTTVKKEKYLLVTSSTWKDWSLFCCYAQSYLVPQGTFLISSVWRVVWKKKCMIILQLQISTHGQVSVMCLKFVKVRQDKDENVSVGESVIQTSWTSYLQNTEGSLLILDIVVWPNNLPFT